MHAPRRSPCRRRPTRRTSMPAPPSRRRAAPRRGRTGPAWGCRPARSGRDHRPTRASDNGRQHAARHGQNGRVMALGRKNSLLAGSDGGARHWAMVASLVATAKLNGVEPQAWLTDVLERMVSGRAKAHELERLLPWTWKAEQLTAAVLA